MKKLFFSAVALVAFSIVSMGNTIELKENLDELKPAESVKRTSHAICKNARVHYYNHLISLDVPHQQASGRAYHIYFQCMGRALSIQ